MWRLGIWSGRSKMPLHLFACTNEEQNLAATNLEWASSFRNREMQAPKVDSPFWLIYSKLISLSLFYFLGAPSDIRCGLPPPAGQPSSCVHIFNCHHPPCSYPLTQWRACQIITALLFRRSLQLGRMLVKWLYLFGLFLFPTLEFTIAHCARARIK